MEDLLARCITVLRNDATSAWLVGGTVRDQLLGRDRHDIDIAVPAGGLSIARKLANALGGAYYPLDVERETGRVVMPDRSVIDVALLRGPDIHSDLAARDFTINAMARSLVEPSQLVDPLHGQLDLQAGLVRAVSDQVFVDDPARLLRAVRLSADLGFAIEPHTRMLLKRDSPGLRNASGERLREELLRILSAKPISDALRLLQDTGLLLQVLPNARFDANRRRIIDNLVLIASHARTLREGPGRQPIDSEEVGSLLAEFQWVAEFDPEIDLSAGQTAACIVRLSALYDDAAAIVADLGELRFRRDEIQYARALVKHGGRVAALPSPTDSLSIHRFFRDTGAGRGQLGLLAVALAGSLGRPDQELTFANVRALLHNYFEAYDTIIEPTPLLNGAELLERFGLRGAAIGQMLTQLVEAQVDGRVDSVSAAERFVAAQLNLKPGN